MLLTRELVKGQDGLFDGHVVELGLLREVEVLQGLPTHDQAGILGNGVPNCLGHKWYRS